MDYLKYTLEIMSVTGLSFLVGASIAAGAAVVSRFWPVKVFLIVKGNKDD